jgi:hypothetical protein
VIVDAFRFNPSILYSPVDFGSELHEKISSFKINTEVALVSLLENLISQDAGKVLSSKFRMKFPIMFTY